MTKILSTFICMLFIAFSSQVFSQKPPQTTPAKSSTKATTQVSKPTVQKPVTSKPAARVNATTPKKTTPSTSINAKPSVAASPQPQEMRATSLVVSHPKPVTEKPVTEESGPAFKPEKPTSGTISAPAKGVDKEALIWKSFLKYRYQNYGVAKRENRHCGCGADIQLVNPTNEKLDIYLKYASNSSLPTLDDTAMPSISSKFMYPTFVIDPGETITIRGTCNGGFIYEVRSHAEDTGDKHSKANTLINPDFLDTGYIRGNCVNKTIVFENEIK